MLQEKITFIDPFTKTERTETFYFNFSEAELAEQELAAEGTLREQLQNIVDSKRGREIMDAFKRIIRDSYGIRTPEGGFRKSPELSAEFMASEAYSVLFMQMMNDPQKSLDFTNAILPASRREGAQKPAAPQDYKPSARDIAAQHKADQEAKVIDDPFAGVPRVADLEQKVTERAPASRKAPEQLAEAINKGTFGNPAEAWARFEATGDPSPIKAPSDDVIGRPPFEG